MRNVRIFYRKKGRMKFVSHLDMNRFMSRLIAKSKIPVWYTEGFNQHIYMNFAVPLSLGFEGDYEILDIRIVDPDFTDTDCLNALKSVEAPDIEFLKACEPIENMKQIAFAEYLLEFGELDAEKITAFLSRESIITTKKGKKGKLKQIDLIPKIKDFKVEDNRLTLLLVAGCEDTLNPSLVMETYFEANGLEPQFFAVTRKAIFNKEGKLFV